MAMVPGWPKGNSNRRANSTILPISEIPKQNGESRSPRRPFLQTQSSLVAAVRQRVRNILARIRTAADRDDNVLLAVHHIGHRRAALRSWHQYGADFLARSLVIRAQHRAAR